MRNGWRITWALLAISCGLMVLSGCKTRREVMQMIGAHEQAKILSIVDSYTEALDNGDSGIWESLYWLDDERFTEIENDKPYVLGRQYIEQISALLRQRGSAEPNQRWYDTKVYFLSSDVAYSTSLRDEINTSTTSRVTLVYLKKGNEWRIIHGHFSNVPE